MNIKAVGATLFLAYFIFQIWYAVHNKLWGKFDRTSQMIWGGVLLAILLVAGFIFYVINTTV